MIGETKETIFLPFYIGDGNKTSRKYGRIGLGLQIAQRLAEFLGGEIRVESELAHGSTFTQLLPRHAG